MARHFETISADAITALKAGEKLRVQVLRSVLAAMKAGQEVAGGDLDEAAEEDILRKAVKTRRDAIEGAQAANRPEIVKSETSELELLQGYLPQMMSGAELQAKVVEVAAEVGFTGPKDTGKFMQAWMKAYKGKAEGRDVQEALKALPIS